ncbi:MAG: tetratricopeptide repeat protein, partial [Planctomycetes bacterium]|nr:tetratricopeptide repeat protein [Planctomycetota bacterium]
ENKKAHNNLGYIYGKQGLYDMALDEFKLAVDEAEAYNNLGYIYYMNGEDENAISTFKKALQINPNLEKARNNLEKLKQKTEG